MGNLVYLIMKPDDGYTSVNARRRNVHTPPPFNHCRVCRIASPLRDVSSIGGALSFAAVRRPFRIRFPSLSRLQSSYEQLAREGDEHEEGKKAKG
ncbi:hypothetical protein PC9H_005597 [Pleurotus ostreatus]|uniref:Uncharacterized protein n=1 Tax=Pleurotus ostreatus TaxID=5322 RepID=A0A8H6ZZU4_PLEOS|nr:uncharacterized protein PC9H_005597 [Pleurotus ostreatus]KAF7433636.1 hypothetical protein PC9H_005597 [Pleurotus ostreatus]